MAFADNGLVGAGIVPGARGLDGVEFQDDRLGTVPLAFEYFSVALDDDGLTSALEDGWKRLTRVGDYSIFVLDVLGDDEVSLCRW